MGDQYWSSKIGTKSFLGALVVNSAVTTTGSTPGTLLEAILALGESYT